MQIGSLIINRMSAHNQSLWLWYDARLGEFWYVLLWRKGRWPYMYRSKDATPPCKRLDDGYDNRGRWFFGRASGLSD